jgi:hypothetical protein
MVGIVAWQHRDRRDAGAGYWSYMLFNTLSAAYLALVPVPPKDYESYYMRLPTPQHAKSK